MTLTPQHAIDAFNQAFGSHRGARALHAKGVLLRGTFTPTPDGAALTHAAHMHQPSVPATVRFSNGSGNPSEPDWKPGPRGIAVKLYPPDGSRTDIMAISSPRFPTRTPEAFIELVGVQAAGVAAVWKLPLFLLEHPETARALPAIAPTLRPPASYASIPYHGIHAFRWIDAQGDGRHVRHKLSPEGPVERLLPPVGWRRGRDYLEREITDRLARGPVRFTLELQIAAAGDPVDDPNAAWPSGRPSVRAGTLEITGPEREREKGGDVLVFDPTRVVDGIELSDDPVLHFRPLAYSESVARRTAGA